jgi:hypothetical protein
MTSSRWFRWAAASAALFAIALLARPPLASAGDGDDPPAPTGGEQPAGEGGDMPAGMADEEGGDDLDDTEQGLSPESVEKATQKGVNWLKQKQAPDGSWGVIHGGVPYPNQPKGDKMYDHPAGPTALAIFTLLKCKVDVSDSSVKKGFKYLKDKWRLPGGSYETSMMLLAVTATADPFKKYKASVAASDRVKLTGENRKWAQDLHAHLLKKRNGPLGWRYDHGSPHPSGVNQDLSSTQMAALALFAADRCGIKTDSKVWNDIITFALEQQDKDGPEADRAVAQDKSRKPDAPKKPGDADKERYGKPPADPPVKDKARGFAYNRDEKLRKDEKESSGGMTACGLGSILFARHILFNRNDKLWAARDQKAVQQSIYDGLAWLNSNFQPLQNPHGGGYHVYYLYCVERAMDLIGAVRLGNHYWYMEMGQTLLGRQKPQGFWDTDSSLEPSDVLDTCFALLFLKRATKDNFAFPSVTPSPDEPGVDNRGKTADEGGD